MSLHPTTDVFPPKFNVIGEGSARLLVVNENEVVDEIDSYTTLFGHNENMRLADGRIPMKG